MTSPEPMPAKLGYRGRVYKRPPRPVSDDGRVWCSVCKQFKDRDQFGTRAKYEVPLYLCRQCHAGRVLARNQALTPEQRAAKNAKRSALHKENKAKDPYIKKRSALRYSFGLTLEQYFAMRDAQGGVCAICGQAPERELVVDHDHRCCPKKGESCGACIRGLLCWPCNLGIGQMGDDPVRLVNAAAYLKNPPYVNEELGLNYA